MIIGIGRSFFKIEFRDTARKGRVTRCVPWRFEGWGALWKALPVDNIAVETSSDRRFTSPPAVSKILAGAEARVPRARADPLARQQGRQTSPLADRAAEAFRAWAQRPAAARLAGC